MNKGFETFFFAIICAILLISCSDPIEPIDRMTAEEIEAMRKASSSSKTLSSSSDISSSSDEAGGSSSSIQSSSSYYATTPPPSSSSSAPSSSSSSLTLCEYAAKNTLSGQIRQYTLETTNGKSYNIFYKDGLFAMGEPLVGGNKYDWTLADGTCTGLEPGGNWRLPTAIEASSYGNSIASEFCSNLGGAHFWTSTEAVAGNVAQEGRMQTFYMGQYCTAGVDAAGRSSDYSIGAVCVKSCF